MQTSTIWTLSTIIMCSLLVSCIRSPAERKKEAELLRTTKYFSSPDRMDTASMSKVIAPPSKTYRKDKHFFDLQKLRILSFSANAPDYLKPYLAKEEDWPNGRIEPAHYRCFAPRGNVKPNQVIIHHTAATLKTTVALFHRCVGVKSAHFVVSKAGKILTMVLPEDRAFHAQGLKNFASFGIEVENGEPYYQRDFLGKRKLRFKNAGGMTGPQEEALIALTKILIKKYDIPVKKELANVFDNPSIPYALPQAINKASLQNQLIDWYRSMYRDGYKFVHHRLKQHKPVTNWQGDSFIKKLNHFYLYADESSLLRARNKAFAYWRRVAPLDGWRLKQIARIEKRVYEEFTDLALIEALAGINIHMASTPSAKTRAYGSHYTTTACPSFLFNHSNKDDFSEREVSHQGHMVQKTRSIFFQWRKAKFEELMLDSPQEAEEKLARVFFPDISGPRVSKLPNSTEAF